MPVPLFATSHERYTAELRERLGAVIASGHYILGPEVEAFEREFATYLGARHCIGVANGTDAITIALKALGVQPGDEVVMPSFTFYATAEASVNAGAKPIFCDIDPDTFCITAETVERAITPATKAIIAVHLFGNVAPVPELRRFGVPILEDSAQAAGASLNGTMAGALGVMLFPSSSGRYAPAGRRGIDVVQIEGYLDALDVSLMRDAIRGRTPPARRCSRSRSTRWARSARTSRPSARDAAAAFDRRVGRPSGADAKGAATLVLQGADLAYVSPNSGVGAGQPVRLVHDPGASTTSARSPIASPHWRAVTDRDPDGARKLARTAPAPRPRPGRSNQLRAPDHRRAHRAARQEDGAAPRRAGEALHGRGRRRGRHAAASPTRTSRSPARPRRCSRRTASSSPSISPILLIVVGLA